MWFWLSLSAAALWGFDYALSGQVLKKISFPTLISIELFFGFIAMVIISLMSGGWKQDIVTLSASKTVVISVVIITLCFIAGNAMITMSIQEKGASIASIIEMSYPLFVVLLTWLIFKENTLNLATVVGGILVFVGVAVIYLFNK